MATMTDLVAEIERAFSSERMPSDAELVRFDGFDELGKACLLEHLSGKTQDDVLHLLREGALGDGSMCTEELEVAEPAGIRYYLKPFLVRLAERLRSDARVLDDETPFFLFAHIKNILEHRGTGTFTEPQLKAISSLVEESLKLASTLADGTWVKDVSRQLREVGTALQSV